MRILPEAVTEECLLHLPPVKSLSITFEFGPGEAVDCVGIVCPMLPAQMVTHQGQAIEKILGAIRIAHSLGASLVGLGGFTSIIGDGGLEIARRSPLPVTSGNTYTAAVILQSVFSAADLLELDLKTARVAIIGATGDIGSVCAKTFVGEVNNLFLVAREQTRLQEFALSLGREYASKIKTLTTPEEAAYNSDIILTTTSATTTVLDYRRIKRGAIVCDVSVPPNIAREACKDRNDIFVFEGGYAAMPYFKNIKTLKFTKHFQHGAIFGCLAETIILALENRFENFSIGRGRIDINRIQLINEIGLKHGFGLAPFFCGDKLYTEKEIEMLQLLSQG